MLFNDTILYNIRYGRPEASDEEVHEAAQAACIHETIVTKFPQASGLAPGYSSAIQILAVAECILNMA